MIFNNRCKLEIPDVHILSEDEYQEYQDLKYQHECDKRDEKLQKQAEEWDKGIEVVESWKCKKCGEFIINGNCGCNSKCLCDQETLEDKYKLLTNY